MILQRIKPVIHLLNIGEGFAFAFCYLTLGLSNACAKLLFVCRRFVKMIHRLNIFSITFEHFCFI